jgi:hypothetical protein
MKGLGKSAGGSNEMLSFRLLPDLNLSELCPTIRLIHSGRSARGVRCFFALEKFNIN